MVPFFILALATVLLRMLGYAGVATVSTWRDAARVGTAAMFVFTGSTHFSGMKYDYAAMIPPPFTGELWVIHLTGLLEIAGAVGLLLPRTRTLAGFCLFALLLALFPANVYAAVSGVEFRGAPPTELWLRGIIQAVFLGTVWWSVIMPGRFRRRTG